MLSAIATDTIGVTRIDFHLTSNSVPDELIGTGTPTLAGWLYHWNTKSVANGTYTLRSVAYGADGKSARSAGVEVTVRN